MDIAVWKTVDGDKQFLEIYVFLYSTIRCAYIGRDSNLMRGRHVYCFDIHFLSARVHLYTYVLYMIRRVIYTRWADFDLNQPPPPIRDHHITGFVLNETKTPPTHRRQPHRESVCHGGGAFVSAAKGHIILYIYTEDIAFRGFSEEAGWRVKPFRTNMLDNVYDMHYIIISAVCKI